MLELLQPYMNYIYSAALALVVLLLTYFVFRALRGSVRGRKGGRLGISEYHEIDKSRRLVLVRRDDVEHLLLIGGGQDIVVESNIGEEVTQPMHRPAPIQQMQTQQPANFDQAQMRPAPRPAVFGDRRPQLRPVDTQGTFRDE